MNLSQLLTLAWSCLFDPKTGAEQFLALRLPRQVTLLAAAAVIVLGVLLMGLGNLVAPTTTPEGEVIQINMIGFMGLQIGAFLFTVYATFWIGRLFGGTGSLDDILLVIVVLNAALLFLQVAQLLASVVAPVLSGIIVVLSLGLGLWLFVNFVTVAHRFESVAKVFGGVLLSIFGLSVLMTLLLSMFGVPIGA